MAQIFVKVLLIMIVLFAFMIPGLVLKKLKMSGEGATYFLSNLLLYVCQPALFIKAFCIFSDDAWKMLGEMSKLTILANFGIVAAISLVAMLALALICKLVFIKSKNKNETNIYTFIAIFSNCSFFGVPFVEMFTNGDPLAVMYVMVFNVVFMVLCWTLGVILITGDVKKISLKKVLLNPAILTGVLGLIIFFVPEINIFMIDGLKQLQILPQYLSYMAAPLSMIIVGLRLADMNIKELFCKKGAYIAGGLRLILAPILTFGIALFFYLMISSSRGALTGSDAYIILAPVICMAMSPAATVVAMAERFDGDKDTATSTFVNNTLISIITIPLIIMAVMALWGVIV